MEVPIEIVQSLIIAGGTFFGAIAAALILEKRGEKKAAKYWEKAKTSPEGQDLFTIFKELRILLKGEQVKKLVTEATEAVGELRTLLKKMKERFEAQPEGIEGEEILLPSLAEEKK